MARMSRVEFSVRAYRLPCVTVAIATLLGVAGPLCGQEPEDDPGSFVLRGRVLDAVTREPIHGAFVAPVGSGTGFLTDTLGNFALRLPRVRYHRLYAEQMGYATTEFAYEVGPEPEALIFLLQPNPIMLKGIEVLTDRFDRRRRMAMGVVQAYDRRDLLTSASVDMVDFIRYETATLIQGCPRDPLRGCVFRRGRMQPMLVCIDEVPAIGGLDELASYRPQDLYLVEVYERGLQVRAYTTHFIEQSARSGRSLMPISLFAQYTC